MPRPDSGTDPTPGPVLGAVDGRTELLLYFTYVVVSKFIIIGCVIFAIIINCGAPLSYS